MCKCSNKKTRTLIRLGRFYCMSIHNTFHQFGDDSCVNTRRQNGKSKYNSEKGTLKYT